MGILRILLALAVVVCHSKPILGITFCGGDMAVNLFFMISGFYMALILTTKYSSTLGFLRMRSLRLFPLYWICLVLVIAGAAGNFWLRHNTTYAVARWMDRDLSIEDAIQGVLGNVCFCANNVFASERMNRLLFIRQSWTLGVESMFYALAPFIVRDVKRILAAAVFCLILAPVFSGWAGRFLFPQFPLFLLGAGMYHVSRTTAKLEHSPLCFLAWASVFVNAENRVLWWLTIAACAVALPALFDFSNTNRFDRLIGEVSYATYLIHWLVLQFTWQMVPYTGWTLFSVLSPFCVVLAGYGLCRLDQRWQPLLRQRAL